MGELTSLAVGAARKAAAAAAKRAEAKAVREAAAAGEATASRAARTATRRAEAEAPSLAAKPKPKAAAAAKPAPKPRSDFVRSKPGSDLAVPAPGKRYHAPELDAPGGLKGADNPLLVSTRRPTPGRGEANFAVQGNPDETMLWQSGDAMRSNPEAFAENMRLLKQEPFMAGASGLRNADRIYDYGLDQGAKNLEFITNELMDPEKVAAARDWYPTAQGFSERAAQRAGLPDQAGYGVQAVLSPQTPWDINVARTDRLMNMFGDQFGVDPEEAARYVLSRQELRSPGAVAMRGPDYARQIASMPYEEITDPFDRFARVSLADATRNDPMVPQALLSGGYGGDTGKITWGNADIINKAWNIMDDPSMDTIRQQLLGGGKVPTFYNNIAAPYSRLPLSTIDTHSAGAFSLSPGGGGDPIVYRSMGLGPPTGTVSTPTTKGAADIAAAGSKGLYGLVSDAHDLARERLGFLYPREVQSATWEGVRDLWGQEGKTPALKQAVADAWRRNPNNPDAARYDIAELLGRPVNRMFAVP